MHNGGLTTVTTASLQNGLLLPGVTAAEGYVVSFVNTTNTTQVYTQSEKFRIEAGNCKCAFGTY